MPTEKNLLTSKRFVNANSIDTFVNVELTSEKSILKPFKTDNVLNIQEKFTEERNASLKFCLYGIVQSKWCDCDSLKVDFYIADSSTNPNVSLLGNRPYRFWVYDKSTSRQANEWSVETKPLDNSNGGLSVNLYRKKKGSYFFPFELDLRTLDKLGDGILTNKSIYIRISEPSKNAFFNSEIPFLFFDDDGALIEFGQETADILNDGEVIEINNNYPFLYDRHWIRRELIPDGPSFVSFVSQDSITLNEGGTDERALNDKLIPVEIALSEPSKSGLETIKVEILYGLDENKIPYTTIEVPSDAILSQNIVRWNFVGENALKYVYLRLKDDYIVEPQERLTLKITPIYGCIADPNRSQILTYYINDNDVPSFVRFESQNIDFTEPRSDGFAGLSVFQAVSIKISFILDKTVLVPGQSFDVYIDRDASDCKSAYGLRNYGNAKWDQQRIFVNETDTQYSTFLMFRGTKQYDKERKIVLKLSGFTSNLAPVNVNNGANELTINVKKNIDDNYATFVIPYNSIAGKTVVRNVYNVPQSSYDEFASPPLFGSGQNTGTNLITDMAYYGAAPTGKLPLNESVYVSGFTDQNVAAQKNIKSLVEEQEFDLIIENSGSTRVYLDYNLYEPGQNLVINIRSGLTFSTTTNVLSYDGEKLILRLPANDVFDSSFPIPIFTPVSGLTFSEQITQSLINSTLDFSATTYGYRNCSYRMFIRNKSYNYAGDSPQTFSQSKKESFDKTNLLTKKILSRNRSGSNGFTYSDTLNFRSGNDSQKKEYYINTRLIASKTRPENPDEAKTGTTLSIVTDEMFYNGVAILPRPGGANYTQSYIFASDRKVIDINSITSLGTASTQYSYILPTSPIIIPGEVSAATLYCPFSFGNLWVQNGYGVVTSSSGFFNQTNVSYDGFIASTSAPQQLSAQRLKSWSSCNPNTRSQAVIEILNTGEVDSFFPDGIVVRPGERLVISENPVSPTNGGAFFHNLIRPLYPLVLPMSTNSGFNKVSEKFLSCSYRISYLNFKIYQPSGSFSNRIVNHSIDFNQVVAPNGIVKPRYLSSEYNDQLFLPYGFFGSACNGSPVTSYKLMKDTRWDKLYVNGIIITPSTQSPIQASQFLEFDDLPPNIPGTRSRDFELCCQSLINLGNNFCYWLYED